MIRLFLKRVQIDYRRGDADSSRETSCLTSVLMVYLEKVVFRVSDLGSEDGVKNCFISFEWLAIVLVAYFGAQKISATMEVSCLVLAS